MLVKTCQSDTSYAGGYMRRWGKLLFCQTALLALVLGITTDSRGVRTSGPFAPRVDAEISSLSNAQFLLRRCGIRVYARNTQRRSGLYVHFKSGRTQRISTSLDALSLESFATASRIVSAVVGE
jgi:hypothetical protein